MEKNEVLGLSAMYGGGVASSCTAPAALISESHMLMVFSALGALSAVCGLVYTIWNGNRNFKLQQQAFETNLALRQLTSVAAQAKEANHG